jgi:PAS domain S-box-containing protein
LEETIFITLDILKRVFNLGGNVMMDINSETLNLLTSNNPSVNYVCGFNGRDWVVNYINDSVEHLTGYPTSHFAGSSAQKLNELIHPSDVLRVRETRVKAITDNKPWESEYRAMKKDGGICWFHEKSVMHSHKNGEIVALGYIFDITERKKRELRDNCLAHISELIICSSSTKNMLHAVLEYLLDVFECDRAWLLTPLDPDSKQYDIAIMRTREDFFLPEGLTVPMDEQTSDLMRMALDSDVPVRFNSSIAPFVPQALTEAFGIKSQIIASISPKIGENWMFGLHHCREEKFWTDNELNLFDEIRHRITESLNTLLFAEELSRSKEYLTNMVNSMPYALIGVNCNGVVTHWNSQAVAIGKNSAEDAMGKKFYELLPRLSGDIEIFERAIKTELVQASSRKIEDHNELVKFEDIKIFPLVGDEIEGAVIILSDITKEQTLQEHLGHSRKMEAIGQLAGGVAHDFNNMLGGIMGAAEMLKMDSPTLPNESVELIDIILTASTNAAELTKKLLSFGRKGRVISSTVNINSVIDEAISILNRTLDRKVSIAIEKKAKETNIVGDGSELQNSIINLVINASHAINSNGKISIETRNICLDESYCENSTFDIVEGEYIEISIRDNGSGISSENLTKIFDPFFTTKLQGEGTGLGLSAVYGAIQEHLGEIMVCSKLGEGTVFHILLPLTEGSTITRKSPQNLIATGSGTILLVDDEHIIRVTGNSMLKKMGYTVLVAENAREAIDVYIRRKDEIDLVVSDMIMPEMNGSELFYELKKIDPNSRVIISSGFTKDESLTQLKNDGLIDFVQKPFSFSELSQAVSEAISV